MCKSFDQASLYTRASVAEPIPASKSVNKLKIEGASEETILGYEAFAVPIECSFQCRWRAVNVAAIYCSQSVLKERPEFRVVEDGGWDRIMDAW